jgi:hypothetical protein
MVTTHPMGEAIAEMSYSLARRLDEGAGLTAAAVNRELRANLLELARMADRGHDDLASQLSTPVRDAAGLQPGDAGAADRGDGEAAG